jgi:hypothetical protein
MKKIIGVVACKDIVEVVYYTNDDQYDPALWA